MHGHKSLRSEFFGTLVAGAQTPRLPRGEVHQLQGCGFHSLLRIPVHRGDFGRGLVLADSRNHHEQNRQADYEPYWQRRA